MAGWIRDRPMPMTLLIPLPSSLPTPMGRSSYWIAAHSNTGASTINVNGLGPVNIYKQDGTALFRQ